ncbi:MAG: plasmid stabilization protein [Gallionellales bacterium RIFCSPLOWO2_12_FULL_59_22]|nr:MAG: plasmid stabilization protein [Gallionellales bacterium RIFCSPLOWO2_02_FULL_59_110]OGT12559.1 MAG: plasmid stabilization protein [Gallionellales bacterium RIFCSPLOWO2_12_FULL_59_22]
MFAVRYSKQATKTLYKMPGGVSQKIQSAMLNIAKNPAAYQGDWKRLEGTEFWRLRVGGWRAICDVQNGELVVLVLKIASRGDAYK